MAYYLNEWDLFTICLLQILIAIVFVARYLNMRIRFYISRWRRVDYVAPLDILFNRILESPSTCADLEVRLLHFASLTAIAMDPPQILVGYCALDQFVCVVRGIGSIISSLHLQQIDTLEMAARLRCVFKFPDVMEMCIGELQAYKPHWPDPSDIDFPRTDLLGYIDHLVDNLGRLLEAKADALGLLKYHTWVLQRTLHYMSCRLKEIPEWRREQADLKAPIESITDLAYQSEYVIDSFLTQHIPTWYCMDEIGHILQNLRGETKELLDIESRDIQAFVSSITYRYFTRGDTIIAISSDTKISRSLNKVFNHPDIIRAFEIRTRGLVGSYRGRRKKKVLLQLLRNASSHEGTSDEDTSETSEFLHNASSSEDASVEYTSVMSKRRLNRSLCNLLSEGVFLIILKDVRDLDALNGILTPLLDYLYQGWGKILLTTPSQELANQCRNEGLRAISKDRTNSTSQSNKPTKSQLTMTTDDNIVIGFKDETQQMLDMLTRGGKKLCIISITGMGGQGKTTLAKNLYRDPLVVGHFDILLQCCVTQVYKKRELLLELLGEVVQNSNSTKNDVELAELLFKTLKGRRFLIFLDDIWKIDAWNDLARCFPDDKNGSRIMFTTRVNELASQAKICNKLQPLLVLSNDESWELLRNKVFQKQSCPPELLGVGRQIAENCKGLPLSVVLIGGLLAKLEKKVDVWEDIAKNLTSRILGDADTYGKDVIELSYKHLPDFLKACLLYFGAFSGDRQIVVQKLVRLWIAEGFIKHTESKNLEDIAMDYLMDLARRNLVTIAQEKSIGGPKSCRVHDLLHEFCLTKAKEENFILQINGYDEHFPSCGDNLDYGTYPNYSSSSTPITYGIYRLSIYSKRNHFVMLKPSGTFVRSLLFFSSDMCPNYPYDISFIFHNFKFLNILDLEEINIGDSLKTINVLVLLKYLAVQSDVDSIPSSIANLWNLEIFLFKGLSTKVVKVPNSIWDMDKLRHVHVNGCVSFDLESYKLEKSSILDNLQTFSTPSLAYGDEMLKLLRLLRGIRKLKCIFLDSWDDARDCNQFPELEFLNQLVSLKVFYNGKGLYPCEFSFPSNLKKLTFSNFRMPWNEVSRLAALSNLEVLKLLDNAFAGEAWEMKDEVFPKLKFLKLSSLNVVQWIASEDHFPCLEHLILHKCERLEEIPSSIGDINTLRTIEVMWCGSSVATSAKKIRNDQLEYGKTINVHIRPTTWAAESSS